MLASSLEEDTILRDLSRYSRRKFGAQILIMKSPLIFARQARSCSPQGCSCQTSQQAHYASCHICIKESEYQLSHRRTSHRGGDCHVMLASIYNCRDNANRIRQSAI